MPVCASTGRGKTFDDHLQRTFDHELEFSYFDTAIQNFCDKHGLLILRWQQNHLKKKHIDPDAYFCITDSPPCRGTGLGLPICR